MKLTKKLGLKVNRFNKVDPKDKNAYLKLKLEKAE